MGFGQWILVGNKYSDDDSYKIAISFFFLSTSKLFVSIPKSNTFKFQWRKANKEVKTKCNKTNMFPKPVTKTQNHFQRDRIKYKDKCTNGEFKDLYI